MKASSILAGDRLQPFIAWVTTPSGAVRRIEILAKCQADAIRWVFTIVPNATAVSARPADRATPLCGALLELDRRTR